MKSVTTWATTTTSTTRPTRFLMSTATISLAPTSGQSWRTEKYGGGYHKEVNYYSNPQVKFKDVPTGVEGKADAGRMITENRFAIAAVGGESEKCSSGSGGGPTTASPTTTTSTKTTTNYGDYGDNYESFYHIGR